MNFRFKHDVMSMASNGWCKKRCTCVNELLEQVDMFYDRTGGRSLISTIALLTSTSNSCQMFTGCIAPVVWTGGHWSLTFFLNSPELCLIIRRPTVVRATSDISNVAGMHAVYCQYQLSTYYTQGEMTSRHLWSRFIRHFVGITWHNVWV